MLPLELQSNESCLTVLPLADADRGASLKRVDFRHEQGQGEQNGGPGDGPIHAQTTHLGSSDFGTHFSGTRFTFLSVSAMLARKLVEARNDPSHVSTCNSKKNGY